MRNIVSVRIPTIGDHWVGAESSMEKRPSLPNVGFLRDCGAVGARIAGSKVHLTRAVLDDGRPLTHRKRERFKEPDLVAALREPAADVGRNGLIHFDIAALKGSFGQLRLFECRLNQCSAEP